jgi:4-diphosphocytidyl-2-C-methyl-D-erythritol kinase
MLYFPSAKINIGLNILNKRPDDFHNIETVFYPVELSDILEIIESPKDSVFPFFTNTGYVIDTSPEKNLCVQAYQMLKKDFDLPPVAIHLHKIIPFGAGLGGGSSDAAFMLKALNSYFNLELDEKQLIQYAARLGSDCAFFIINKALLARGRGEILESIDLSLKDYYILLVTSPLHVSTAQAYSWVKPEIPAHPLSKLIEQPIESWREFIINDFEKQIFKKYSFFTETKRKLYELGAVFVSMSGSGSTIYGIFREKPDMKIIFPGCLVWQGKLK